MASRLFLGPKLQYPIPHILMHLYSSYSHLLVFPGTPHILQPLALTEPCLLSDLTFLPSPPRKLSLMSLPKEALSSVSSPFYPCPLTSLYSVFTLHHTSHRLFVFASGIYEGCRNMNTVAVTHTEEGRGDWVSRPDKQCSIGDMAKFQHQQSTFFFA